MDTESKTFMDAFGSGILLGLTLSILTGPILFTLIQTSIEEGFRAGIAVGAGIWISDILFVFCAYFGINYITEMTSWQGFELTLGIAGGLILIGVGLVLALKKSPSFHDFSKFGIRYNSYFKLWSRGFFINTVNPFTFFFWFISCTALVNDMAGENADLFFYSGILGTIIFTDAFKVFAAKKIQKKLKPNVVLWMRRISGIALVVFGLVLMARVTFDLG